MLLDGEKEEVLQKHETKQNMFMWRFAMNICTVVKFLHIGSRRCWKKQLKKKTRQIKVRNTACEGVCVSKATEYSYRVSAGDFKKK